MAMKITFESDIKGFARVEQALTTQKKLIDESADAMKRFNESKSGGTRNEDDSKHSDSLRVTAKRIEDLTGALGTLTKSQTGLKSFMDLFSGFGKQLGDFNKTAATQVLETMTKQIDLLKGSITSAGATLKNLQTEIKQAHAAGRTEEAATKETEAAKLGVKMMGENDLLKNLQVSKFMHQPIGNFFGTEGGPSISGIMSGGAKAYAGMYAGATAGIKIAEKALNYEYSGARAEVSQFGREVSVGEAAANGNISRQMEIDRGLGVEGGFRKSMMLGPGDTLDRTASGSFFEEMLLRLKHFKGGLTGDFTTYRELVEKRGDELRPLDAKLSFAQDKAGATINNLIRNPTFDALSRRVGHAAATQLMGSITAGGATKEEGLSVLKSMSAYGTTNAFRNISDAETRPVTGTSQEEIFYNDPRAIFTAQRKLGISDRATTELARQTYYNLAATGTLGMAMGAMGPGGARTVEAGSMMADYIANRQAKFETGGTNASEVSGVAAATIATLDQNTIGQPKLDAMTATKAGIQTAEFVSGNIGTPGNLGSEAQTQALYSLGIRNPLAVSQLQQLISQGQLSRVVNLIHGMNPNASPDDIMGKINQAGAVPFKFAKQLAMSTPDGQRAEEVWKKETGAGLVESQMGGGVGTALTAGLQGLDKEHSVFDLKTMEAIKSGQQVGTPQKITTTGLDAVKGGEALTDKAALDVAKSIAEAVGDKTGMAIVNQIAQGYIELGNKIRQSAEDTKKADVKSKEDTEAFNENFLGIKYLDRSKK